MRERSPGVKLLLVGLVALILCIPLIMVYALVQDREAQSQTAQSSIEAGWGGAQTVSGPVVAIPYVRQSIQSETIDGRTVARTVNVRDEIYLSPEAQQIRTAVEPEKRSYSIYSSVIYRAAMGGTAKFVLPEQLRVEGVDRDALMLDQAELRFGISDPRGLQNDVRAAVGGKPIELLPGKGTASSGGAGFHGALEWDGSPVELSWSYGLRGSRNISLVPRGGETRWDVTSSWPHPSFGGDFLPEEKEVSGEGFTATYGVSNLALGQSLAMADDPGPPAISLPREADPYTGLPYAEAAGQTKAASIGLVEPVDLYSQVDRSVKYGFLFIGFTFLAFLMFDIVGGARVASAEYLMTGAGLVLFFVLLLAFAEVIGFAWAYVVASGAIIGLLTSYSAAVLKSWKRAQFIGALLVGLHALIFVLLSLEALSLVIGSLLLFAALAGLMYATRNVDWSGVGRKDDGEPVNA